MMRILITASFVFVAACAVEVQPGILVGGPVATFTACPGSAQVGVPFTVTGNATSALTLASVELSMAPFEPVSEPTITVTPTAPGLLTARLVVTEQDTNLIAEARCRILVAGDPIDAGDDTETDDVGDTDTDDTGDTVADDTGDTGGDDTGDEDIVDTGGVDLPGDDPVAPGTPVDVTGQFAMISYDRPELNSFTLDPMRQCAASPTLTLVELTQTGTQISMTMQTCDFTLPAVRVLAADIQETTAPDPLLRALPLLGPFTFNLNQAIAGAGFAPPLAQVGRPMVLGATLSDPVNDELPWTGYDERVVDSDLNGFPGVSISSEFGLQHVVMRHTIRAFSGLVKSSNIIEGRNEGDFRVDNESSILSFLNVFVPSGTGLPSTFQMRRADGQNGSVEWRGADANLTCDDLRTHSAAIEAAFPPLANPADCPSY